MSSFDWSERPVRVTAFGQTATGITRSHNEDSFLIAELRKDDANPCFRQDSLKDTAAIARSGVFDLGPAGALLIVADGMGGAAAGEVASGMAVTAVLERMEEAWLPERARTADRFAHHLRRAVEVANDRIYERGRARADESGMGSTATVVGLFDGHAYLAQVGDSRAYLVRGDTVTQLTQDQTMVQQMVESGAMRPEEAEQSEYRHVILQALGSEPSVDVALTYQPLRRRDHLVICSDGLSGMVNAEEIREHVVQSSTLAESCASLVALANEHGGRDNITVVMARVDGSGLEDPRPDDRITLKPLVVDEP